MDLENEPLHEGPLAKHTRGHPELPRVTTLHERDVTVALIEAELGGHTLQVTGSAKRHPKDDPDQVIGEALAIARALEVASRQFHTFANARVREQEQQRDVEQLKKMLSELEHARARGRDAGAAQ